MQIVCGIFIKLLKILSFAISPVEKQSTERGEKSFDPLNHLGSEYADKVSGQMIGDILGQDSGLER